MRGYCHFSSEDGTSPCFFPWPCLAWVKCLRRVWHVEAICKNDITMICIILYLSGICENKSVKVDEVLIDTTAVGTNKTLWIVGAGAVR